MIALTPFLRLHLFFGNFQVRQHKMLRELDELIWPTRVENRIRQIVDMLLHPLRGDAPSPSGPRVLRMQARASHVKVKVWIVQLQFVELFIEDDVIGRANAVEDGDSRGQLAPRGFPNKGPKRGHTGTTRNADQVFSRFENGQKSTGRGKHYHLVTRFSPIDNPCA